MSDYINSSNKKPQKCNVRLEELLDVIENKNILQKFGSVDELVTKLNSSTTDGLAEDQLDFIFRAQYYGENFIAPRPPNSFFFYLGKALQDTILIFLMVAAFVMLIVGAITDPEFGWIEGIAILIAVLVVSIVTAINDFQKEKQFIKLQKKIKLGSTVVVTRGGVTSEISARNLLVGDIIFLKYGDQIPADSAIISSNDILVDESSLTGESDLIKKDKSKNILVYSGTNVMQGSGKAVVLAVGINSQSGKIMQLLGVTGNKPNDKKNKETDKNKIKKEHDKRKLVASTVASFDDSSNREQDILSVASILPDSKQTNTAVNNSTINDDETNFDKTQSILQSKLTRLALIIGKVGIAAGVLITTILLIRFCVTTYTGPTQRKFEYSDLLEFLNFLVIGFSILIVAIPEGLPLAVTLSLAFSVYKMLKDNNLVRQLYSCETMGNATTICSDKTGTLTSNRMTVVQLYCQQKYYTSTLPDLKCLTSATTDIATQANSVDFISPVKDRPDQQQQTDETLSIHDKYQFHHIMSSNIAINKSVESAVEQPKFVGALPTQVGNKTECALIGYMIQSLNCTVAQYQQVYDQDKIIKIFPFNSEKKMMTTVVELESLQLPPPPSTTAPVTEQDFSRVTKIRVLTKGAPEFVFSRCSKIITDCTTMQTAGFGGKVQSELKGILSSMASGSLRTIAMAYRDIDLNTFTTTGNEKLDPFFNIQDFDDSSITQDMTAICIFGIEDPVRPEVPKAIIDCNKAGVVVRMVTGDNLLTAKAIAEKCGIYDSTKNHIVLDSRRFNRFVRDETGKFDQSKFDRLWPRLRVLARSSPKDKYILVNGIINSKRNKNREVVAVTGDGTNDAPALKKADVGFAMGISGTDVAKEASDIIITDDNFASIVKALMWGRNVYDAISKFIQFQLTVNIVAILISSFTTIIFGINVLKAIQLLWVNLIMDSLASLALATDKPTPDLLDRKPYGRNKSLLSSKMIRFILFHSLYQLLLLIILIFFADDLFNIPNGFQLDLLDLKNYPNNQHLTIIFNVFVIMQIFNEINARRVHGERNVFRKILLNRIFMIVILVTFLLQVIIVQFTGIVFSVSPLDAEQWMWCVFIGFSEMLFHQIILLIPPIKINKKYRFGQKEDTESILTNYDDLVKELDTDAKVLWIRGLYRLRQQLRVVSAFKRLLEQNSNRTITESELKKYQEEALHNDQHLKNNEKILKKGWTIEEPPKDTFNN